MKEILIWLITIVLLVVGSVIGLALYISGHPFDGVPFIVFIGLVGLLVYELKSKD